MPKRQYCELEGQLTCLRLVHFHLQASHGKCHRARLASDLRPKWCVQWKRSVTLDDIVKLLGDVRGFVDIPQQVQSAQEAKVYPQLQVFDCKQMALFSKAIQYSYI